MTKDEALKLALEAFDSMIGRKPERVEQAITAIKEALAQTQEPVVWEQFHEHMAGPFYKAPPQPEQEPLAWISTGPARMIHWTSDKPAYGDDWVPLYTTPPQREFVGLTKEEIAEFDTWHDNREEEVGWCNPSEIVAYIEAKLKEKNT